MKDLLAVSAVAEARPGLGLVAAPTLVASILFGAPLETPVASTVARVAGVALLALGSACWRARRDGHGLAARGVVGGMVVYNAGVLAVLVHAGMGLGLSGIGLWPVAMLHALMAAWCVATLSRPPATSV